MRRECESLMEQRNASRTLLKSNKNFLKKGTAFDKSMILNILKSKFKEKITSGAANYSNARSNSLIYSEIKKEIPNEFKDIIGPEEMLRMSRILSGINLKTTDMDSKIQNAIGMKVVKSKIETMDSNLDDNETLKSIKRW